ncbi:hypothetical protein P5W98_03290 [Paraburkholderia sp. A1BS-2L]|uniref:hypothetical protein n=1 Tax=Paraburkholderia sp. A1BS-2L TaxID=3028373 RepID=UPI003DA8A97E
MNISSAKRAIDFPLALATCLLTFIIATAALFAVMQGVNAPNIVTTWVPAYGLTAMVGWAIYMGRMRGLCCTIGASLLIVGCALVSNIYFDFSSDGLGYHANGIYQLAEHFDFLRSSLTGRYAIYINSYPKLSWFYSAALMKMTGNYEFGKSINLILLLAAALVTWSVMRGAPILARVTGVLCICANPIIVSQIFTHYVDGCMAALLSIQVLCIYGFFWRESSRQLIIAFALASIGAATLKHTGLVFSTLLVGGLFILARARKVTLGLRAWHIAALVGTFSILAINPYVKNLVEGHHIFYPAMGEGRIKTLISGQTTPEFHALNRFSQLGLSVFGRTRNENPFDKSTPRVPVIKVPFTVDELELKYSGAIDPRWGGWGPLFGGACIAALALGALCRKSVRSTAPLLVILATLCVISPESWWARLNPQLYIFVAVVAILGLLERRVAAYALAAVLLINGGIVGYETTRMIQSGNAYLQQVTSELSDNMRVPLYWTKTVEDLTPIFKRLGADTEMCEPGACRQLACKEILGETVCAFHTH